MARTVSGMTSTSTTRPADGQVHGSDGQLLEPTTASAELDWLAPHLDVDAMAGTDGPWLDFWFREVDPDRMPTLALSILVEKQ